MEFKAPLVTCLAHYLAFLGSILPTNDNSCPTDGHARCTFVGRILPFLFFLFFQVSFKGSFPYSSKDLSDTIEGKDTYCIINNKLTFGTRKHNEDVTYFTSGVR